MTILRVVLFRMSSAWPGRLYRCSDLQHSLSDRSTFSSQHLLLDGFMSLTEGTLG